MILSGYDAGFRRTMELQNIRRWAVFKMWNMDDASRKLNLPSFL